jgi:hypothetical protein
MHPKNLQMTEDLGNQQKVTGNLKRYALLRPTVLEDDHNLVAGQQ